MKIFTVSEAEEGARQIQMNVGYVTQSLHYLMKTGWIIRLKRGYFGEYRFSEDLDFTATKKAPIGEALLQFLLETCDYAERQAREYVPIRLNLARYMEKHPHPGGQEAFTIRAQFPCYKEPLTKVMIEVSRDETILLEPVKKHLLHNYGEPIEQEMTIYARRNRPRKTKSYFTAYQKAS